MKIIISRTDAIGDVILTLPLAGFIKQKLPQSTIIFIAKNYTIPVIEHCEHIDQIINYSDLETLDNFLAAEVLARYNADVILHILPNKKIAKAAKLAKIPRRVGTKNRFYHWITCNKLLNISRKNSQLHEAQLNLIFAKAFGFYENLDLADISKLYGFVATKQVENKNKIKLEANKKNIILHPKSAGSAREWGINNFNILVSILPADKFNFYITGTSREKEAIEAEFDFNKPNVFNLIGLLNLAELIDFIGNCDILLAASTGPLHIAAAIGINAIGLYPPIRPMHAGRWSPIGDKAKYFTKDIACSKCRKSNSCQCLREISPYEVADYILQVIT